MFYWKNEIESVEGTTVTFTDGTSLIIEEKNKVLFTDEPMDADKLTTFWNMNIAKEIVDVLIDHNIVMSDFERILGYVRQTIEEKNNSGLVAKIGKEKLDVLARVYGATGEVSDNVSVQCIRAKDLFI